MFELEKRTAPLIEHFHCVCPLSTEQPSAEFISAWQTYCAAVEELFDTMIAKRTPETDLHKVVMQDIKNKLQYFFGGKLAGVRQLAYFPLATPMAIRKLGEELRELSVWHEVRFA